MKIQFTTMLPVNKIKRDVRSSANYGHKPLNFTATDVVSFGASKSYEEKSLDELQEIFDEKIVPFMKKNKELYKAIGVIGYNSQNSLKALSEADNRYSVVVANLINKEVDGDLQKYLDIADKGYENESKFQKLKGLIQKSSLYNNSNELKSELVKAELVFNNSNETNKLSSLKAVSDKVKGNTFQVLFNVTLKNNEPNLYDKFDKTSVVNKSALYYLMTIPYQDAVNLQKDINETKENLHAPKEHWYDNYKKIEKLFDFTNTILKDIDFSEQILPDAEKFVLDSKNSSEFYPTVDEIDAAYNRMTDTCKRYQEKNYSTLNNYFQENFLQSGKEVNLYKANREIELQEKALEKINNLMLDIKTDYIAKQNDAIIITHPASESQKTPKQ